MEVAVANCLEDLPPNLAALQGSDEAVQRAPVAVNWASHFETEARLVP